MERSGVAILAAMVMVSVLSGCTTFNGVKPINPLLNTFEPGGPMVDDLNPLLEWEAQEGEAVTYDLRIFEQKVSPESFLGVHGRYNALVYARDGLESNQHRVQQTLSPNTAYSWSVKPNTEGAEWSSYNFYYFVLVAWGFGFDMPHRFHTPADVVSYEHESTGNID